MEKDSGGGGARYRVVLDNGGREMDSPRFRAILRATSGRRKRAPDIKSFSHELNSKGLQHPMRKTRGVNSPEEFIGAIKTKFIKLKEEVDSELGVFAGDLVGILERAAAKDQDWRVALEDLLVVAQKFAEMSPEEFCVKCEGIVQGLDDRRQELTTGVLKQTLTRILFILTRCTRFVQFRKEGGGYAQDKQYVLGLHQLSYPFQVLRRHRLGYACQTNASWQLSYVVVCRLHLFLLQTMNTIQVILLAVMRGVVLMSKSMQSPTRSETSSMSCGSSPQSCDYDEVIQVMSRNSK